MSERSSLVPEAPGGGGNCSDDGTIKAAADVAAGLPCSWRSAVKRSRMIATDATKVDVTSTARTTNDWQPHGTVPCVVRAELRSSLCSTTLYVRRILWSIHSSCNKCRARVFARPPCSGVLRRGSAVVSPGVSMNHMKISKVNEERNDKVYEINP